MRVLFLFWLFLTGAPLGAAEAPDLTCLPPAEGPLWLRDFTEAQRKRVSADWEPAEDGGTAVYLIEGTYPEPVDESRPYDKYTHRSEIEARETWACGKDRVSRFQSVAGTVETELAWKRKEEGTRERFESENRFTIHSPDDYRHAGHESEHAIEVRQPGVEKDFEQTVEWTQTWDAAGVPVIRGRTRERAEETYHLPEEKGRVLAGAVPVPGFEPGTLEPGLRMTVERRTEGRLEGPLEPVSVQTRQVVRQARGDKVVEKREIESRVTNQYRYSPKGKRYDFVQSEELYEEKTVNVERGLLAHFARLDTWADPEAPPVKTSFWKDTYKKTKFGASSELTVSSKGHGLLPAIFHLNEREGTYSRITDFGSTGRILRFLVVFFPAKGKGNQTLMDLHFSETGALKEFTVADDAINAYDNPFETLAALQALQKQVDRVKELERLTALEALPGRTPRDGDYPVIPTLGAYSLNPGP